MEIRPVRGTWNDMEIFSPCVKVEPLTPATPHHGNHDQEKHLVNRPLPARLTYGNSGDRDGLHVFSPVLQDHELLSSRESDESDRRLSDCQYIQSGSRKYTSYDSSSTPKPGASQTEASATMQGLEGELGRPNYAKTNFRFGDHLGNGEYSTPHSDAAEESPPRAGNGAILRHGSSIEDDRGLKNPDSNTFQRQRQPEDSEHEQRHIGAIQHGDNDGNRTVQQFATQLLSNEVTKLLEVFREDVFERMENLHLDMLRQNLETRRNVEAQLKYTEAVWEEMKKLREDMREHELNVVARLSRIEDELKLARGKGQRPLQGFCPF